MNEDARRICGQLNLHHLTEPVSSEYCQAILNDISSRDIYGFGSYFINLVNVSFLMSGEDNTNSTTTMAPGPVMDPPKTIAGLSVETFSYIFLAIGGAAPVLFLIIVAISMKWYKHRKLKRWRKYQSRQNVTRSLWEMERKQYFKSHAKPADYKSYMDNVHDSTDYPHMLNRSSISQNDGTSQYPRYSATQNITVSDSNPDVYFRETPISQVYSHDRLSERRKLSHIKTGSLPNKPYHFVRTMPDTRLETLKKRELAAPSPHPPPSINSEEALALQSFDQIYQDIDLDNGSSIYTSSSSENRIKTRPQKVTRSQNEASTSSDRTKLSLSDNKTITVDLHFSRLSHSQTAISEESTSRTSDSSTLSDLNRRPNILPLLPETSGSSKIAEPRTQNTHPPVSSVSSNTSRDTPKYDGSFSKDLIGSTEKPYLSLSYTNTAYLKQDTPDSPDIEITRL